MLADFLLPMHIGLRIEKRRAYLVVEFAYLNEWSRPWRT